MKNKNTVCAEFTPSIHNIQVNGGLTAFVRASLDFRGNEDNPTTKINDEIEIVPWGEENSLPYDILDYIESDETLSTCQIFNAEILYGSGLQYMTENATPTVKSQVDEFLLCNNLPDYFLGVCQDLKHYCFAVTVIVLNNEPSPKIVEFFRKEACHCRFSPADNKGVVKCVYYADWRKNNPENIETIPLLDGHAPLKDLLIRTGQRADAQGKMKDSHERKFAIVSRIPTPDHTYYPIPYYAALFRGKWYSIKQLIGIGKEAKLKNSAPIKYLVEISDRYWDRIWDARKIVDAKKRQESIKEEQDKILEFLTGIENSGKAWFSMFYRNAKGEEVSEIKITKIETDKEGGDWSTDIIEAINMICFTMRVHSNLVGSVPGKSQSNNSGSDKRELYTIAQALQKPYRDILFQPHKMIIYFNKWTNVYPDVPFIQLTTLDEHKDAKKVTVEKPRDDEDN